MKKNILNVLVEITIKWHFKRNQKSVSYTHLEDVFKTMDMLSGGERGRVVLMKLLLSRCNFLILDEPTNHLDIESKEVLEDALMNFEGTILFISHDRYFINKLATKVVEMSSHGSHTYSCLLYTSRCV